MNVHVSQMAAKISMAACNSLSIPFMELCDGSITIRLSRYNDLNEVFPGAIDKHILDDLLVLLAGSVIFSDDGSYVIKEDTKELIPKYLELLHVSMTSDQVVDMYREIEGDIERLRDVVLIRMEKGFDSTKDLARFILKLRKKHILFTGHDKESICYMNPLQRRELIANDREDLVELYYRAGAKKILLDL